MKSSMALQPVRIFAAYPPFWKAGFSRRGALAPLRLGCLVGQASTPAAGLQTRALEVAE